MEQSVRTAPPHRPESLRTPGEFTRVMRTGRRARHRVLQLVTLHTGAPATRVGLSVGKQIGGAVVRNRLKRRLRMIIRDLDWLPGHNVVILARAGAESESFDDLTSAVSDCAHYLRLLAPEEAEGA